MACDQRVANLVVSRVIPVFLVGIIGYACFTFTKPLCIDYLIRPTLSHGSHSRRVDTAIGLLVGFYILLVLCIGTFIRLITTILFNPGYLPRGREWAEQQAREDKEQVNKKRKGRRRSRGAGSKAEKEESQRRTSEVGLGGNLEKAGFPSDSLGLEAFYTKDVFVCQQDGKPSWCTTCCQYKTDRAHHCREVGRCVRKMDHFCPWVGGVVSETSFKFFIQFLFYALLFGGYNLIVMAVFTAELRRHGNVDVHYIIILGVSGLFSLFAAGMLGSSLQLSWLNSSTIENLNRRTKVWTLAILIPRPQDFYAARSGLPPMFPTVTFPEAGSEPSETAPPNTPRREFAILHTRPGENPWDLGSRFANLCEVMGYSLFDWFIPLRHSPCADHSGQESAFALGPVVQRLRREAGIIEDESASEGREARRGGSRKKKRRSHRKRDHRHHHDESTRHSGRVERSPSPRGAGAQEN